MQQPRVALACRDDATGARLRHCLEFLEIPVGDAAAADAILLTDSPVDHRQSRGPVVQLGGETLAEGVVARLPLPPTYDQLTQVLALAQAALEAGEAVALAPVLLREFQDLAGVSPALLRIKRLMGQVAGTDATVLVTGESGTGKEVVARCLHRASTRADRPFVPVNCGAIPGELLESELFGHEKGAFTGAVTAKKGRFELADGGTLFLDEIGDMPLPMQVKILRALQERSIERIGAVRSTPCDVRIIAATHQNLEALIREGRFREDLYYRLNVFPIVMPPLRERAEDIELIISALASRSESSGGVVTFTAEALDVIRHYGWPGNVRELANVVQRLLISHPGEVITPDKLPARLCQGQGPTAQGNTPPAIAASAPAGEEPAVVLPVNGIDLRQFLGDLEKSLIEQALNDTESVVARAADRLHIRRTTLVEKMRKYGIRRADER